MRAALILAALIGGLFRTQAAPPSTTRPRIVTTVFPVYCLTRLVAGETANVMNLLPNGAGPHDYQFTPQDFRLLAGADLILLNGLGLEDWLVIPINYPITRLPDYPIT